MFTNLNTRLYCVLIFVLKRLKGWSPSLWTPFQEKKRKKKEFLPVGSIIGFLSRVRILSTGCSNFLCDKVTYRNRDSPVPPVELGRYNQTEWFCVLSDKRNWSQSVGPPYNSFSFLEKGLITVHFLVSLKRLEDVKTLERFLKCH